MNEYEIVIIELALGIAKKSNRIKELEEDYKTLQKEYTDLTYDLSQARKYGQGLRNDLHDLSKEFIQWKSLNNKSKEEKSEWEKHQDVKNGCTGPK
jgi:hypothetical protein